MKTKNYIFSILLVLILGVSSALQTNTYASGGGGCSSCECNNTCEPEECDNGGTDYPTCTPPSCSNGASNYPDCTFDYCTNGASNYPDCTFECTNGASNYPDCTFECSNGASNYPDCTFNYCTNGASNYPLCTFPRCANGATDYPICTVIVPVCTNGASNYPACTIACANGAKDYPRCTPPVNLLCLPKKFTAVPSSGTGGICSGWSFILDQSYPKNAGVYVEQFFKWTCTDGVGAITCTYKLDVVSCLDDTILCPDNKTKLKRSGDKCEFPACPVNPGCAADTITCKDGTKLARSGDTCDFPSCPVNPECKTDTITCKDGTKLARSGDTCEFPACPKENVYSVWGTVKWDNNDGLGGVGVKLFLKSDENFVDPVGWSTTNADGSYKIQGIAPGDYNVVASDTSDVIFFSSVKGVTIEKTNDLGNNFFGTSKINKDPVITTAIKTGLVGDPDVIKWIDTVTGWTKDEDNTTTTELTDDKKDSTTSAEKTSAEENMSLESENGENTFNVSKTATQYSFNPFSTNSIISLLEKWYTLENKSYSPISLSLIYKYANQNAICGNGVVEAWETCDAWKNNGKPKQCSLDCLYIGEVRFSDLASNSLKNAKKSTKSGVVGNFKLLAKNSISKVTGTVENSVESVKSIITENTSPETRKVIKQVAEVTVEVAKYSVVWVTSLLVATAGALNIMVFKSQWKSYTVQDGDTFENIGSKFNMTERALKRRNGIDKKKTLRPGMKIKVRNRAFIEKDYLNQLQSVLTDALKTRNHWNVAERIEQMFAKKK